ncbi:hypothetical protein AB0M54_28860 [Actinoplanes sp. NPDC051470]|uniref:hypothetical protein n=1 Tax=Actinoplanes sp. NPDC051470 TaxID=3157224 RepID=UPI003419DAC6
MGKPFRWLVVVALALSVAGCGGFDPAEERPCDFVATDELLDYQLRRAVNQDDRCVYAKRDLAEDTLDGLTVTYLAETPANVAQRLGLEPVTVVDADDTRIEFQGSRMDENLGRPDPRRGHCWLAAPIGDDRTMVVDLTIDTSSVRWVSIEPITEPCAYVAHDKRHLGLLLEKLE